MKLAVSAALALAALAFAGSAGAATQAHHLAGSDHHRAGHVRHSRETCARWKREHRNEPGREPSPAICFEHGD